MHYDKDQFIWEVTNEAVMLRKHATKEELNRLCITFLNPTSQWTCIYGLTTGDCFSPRATELITLCCPRFFKPGAITRENDLDNVFYNTNGTNAKEFKDVTTGRRNYDNLLFSAIEIYITLPEAKKENLVAYLRGETKKLDLYF